MNMEVTHLDTLARKKSSIDGILRSHDTQKYNEASNIEALKYFDNLSGNNHQPADDVGIFETQGGSSFSAHCRVVQVSGLTRFRN